jgi:hypothetical protein
MVRWTLLVAMITAAIAVAAGATDRPPGVLAAWAHPEPGDEDGDGVVDDLDNCPAARNADQRNSDGDGRPGGDAAGDACDGDDDADGVPDEADGCRADADPEQRDANGVADGDGMGDACEGDRDGDGASDAVDSCREVPNPFQEDADRDGVGDPCDPDDDDDGVFDDRDNCPMVFNTDQGDADVDGRGGACDPQEEAAVYDFTPPRVTVQLAAPARFAALRGGLPVALRCSEACAATVRLVLAPRPASRLRLGRRRVVARGSAQLAAAGATYAFVRFERRARRVLWRQRSVRLTLRVVARDAARNDRTVVRRVTLRR